MAARLAVAAAGVRSAREIAAWSHAALDRALDCEAELWVAIANDEATLLGAFQRGTAIDGPLWRRGSGGPSVRTGPGTVHLALSLAHPRVVGADAKRIVNRAVRPLLRALTKTGHTAHFFGRDWISVKHVPAAWAGYAHDSATGRTLFEAFVAVSTPFAGEGRASFLGKAPGTLAELGGRPVDPERIAQAIADAYAEGRETAMLQPAIAASSDADLRADPPWTAPVDEAIGTVGAGVDAAGKLRVGGDLLVSRDALAHLEDAIARLPPGSSIDDVGHRVDSCLGGPDVAVDGLRSLTSIRDAVAAALTRRERTSRGG
jgi:hypothetical protein